MITLQNGKNFYMYKKHTYTFGFQSRVGQRWRCSRGCKAYIMVTKDGELLSSVGEHSHHPLQYYITADGKYVRVT